MQNIDISTMILKSICPNNEIMYDVNGNPSMMVYIPKFKMSEVSDGGSDDVHPAFIVNGEERDGFWVSKYMNADVEGLGCSLPAVTPCNFIDIDVAKDKTAGKGEGWHLMTCMEWGAIALWSKKNGSMPRGNTDYGKDRHEAIHKAIPVPEDANMDCEEGRVLTGTGPLSWSHDGTVGGIWDLVGNLSEWVGGIRMVYGEIQVIPNNDGADRRNSQTSDSELWRAIDGKTGKYIVPDGKGTTPGSVKMDFWDEIPYPGTITDGWSSKWFLSTRQTNRKDRIRRCDFHFIECDDTIGPKARELLIALGLIPDHPEYFDYQDEYIYHNNGRPECYMYRGCTYNTGSFCGIFVWSCSFGKEQSISLQGFRAAYVPPKK